jgi:hypothetical protein
MYRSSSCHSAAVRYRLRDLPRWCNSPGTGWLVVGERGNGRPCDATMRKLCANMYVPGLRQPWPVLGTVPPSGQPILARGTGCSPAERLCRSV